MGFLKDRSMESSDVIVFWLSIAEERAFCSVIAGQYGKELMMMMLEKHPCRHTSKESLVF